MKSFNLGLLPAIVKAQGPGFLLLIYKLLLYLWGKVEFLVQKEKNIEKLLHWKLLHQVEVSGQGK